MSSFDSIVCLEQHFSLPGVIERPEVVPDDGISGDPGWKVTVFDNSVNTYQEVIAILMAATNCSPEEAYIEAWEIDHYGKSDVHFAVEGECHAAAAVIAQIGIQVEVAKES